MPPEPPEPPAPAAPSVSAIARDRAVVPFLVAQGANTFALTMQAAAIGKQVYDITDSELALGMLGLVEFLPALLLLPLTGSAADRFDRRRLAAAALVVEIAVSVMLAAYALSGPSNVLPIFGLALLFGTARAFGSPAMRSMTPLVAPPHGLPRLVAMSSVTWQFGLIAGPASSGLLYEADPALPYLVAAAAAGVAAVAVIAVRFRSPQERTPADERTTLHHALEGLRFVRRQPILLGAISLDLFAVLFGGALALLPAIAEDRLHVGNVGYGWLRAAPGVGAMLVSALLAIRPLRSRVGSVLIVVVAVFGAGTVVLGVTHDYVVAFVALVILAGADSVSVFIRVTLVPLATPDHMRGRVSAVENVFLGASNEVGAFESGVAATLVGVGPAVVIGGVATLVVVGLWSVLFPSLRNVDTFDDAAADHSTRPPPAPMIATGGAVLDRELP